MKLVPFIAAAILGGLLPCFAAVNLEGKVLRLDSLPKQGVVVGLSGTKLSDTTNAAGEWSLIEAASGIVRGMVPTMPVSSHLVVRNGRIQMSLAGCDVFGREAAGAVTLPSATPFAGAGRTSATGGFDTLVYSWNGKTILRDTIARDSLVRKDIVRHFDTTVNPAITHGYVTDIQNHFYRTVKIGTQTWMAENLNDKVDSSWCYANSTDSCSKYGRLYTWAAAMGLGTSYNGKMWSGALPNQGICPNGWHVPSDSEESALETYVGESNAGTKLKSTSGWLYSGNGQDLYGFHAIPAGFRSFGVASYNDIGGRVRFWSSTENGAFLAMFRDLNSGVGDLYRSYEDKTGGFSVRCLKDGP